MGVVGATAAVAGAASNYILKYNKSFYEQKIAELEGYSNMLKQHLGYLENYRNQVRQFWNDDDAESYLKALSISITGVKNAIDRVDNLKILYTDISGDLSSAKADVSGIVSEAVSLISGLGIVE